jgi:hypothetical protein
MVCFPLGCIVNRLILVPVLSREFVEDAIKLLVAQFIPLKPADLEEWMEDPEEWINSEEKENAQWEYELRVRGFSRFLRSNSKLHPKPCAERVLLTFANQYPTYVIPLLVATFRQVICKYISYLGLIMVDLRAYG